MTTALGVDCRVDIEHAWDMFDLTREDHYRNLLVDHYHFLVDATAEHLRRRLSDAVELDDLVSAGGLGLMHAVETFDRTRAVRFETYCVYRIRGSILDELRRTDWVPRSARRRTQEVARVEQSLKARLGRRPRDSEVAGELGMEPAEFEKLRAGNLVPRLTSLDEICHGGHDGQGIRRLDAMAAQRVQEPCRRERRREWMYQLTHDLSRTEKLILVLYYCEELTMREIGVTLGLSESRVSQMHSLLLMRLRGTISRKSVAFIPDD